MALPENSSATVIEEQVTANKSEVSNLSVRDLFYKYIRFFPFFILSVALALLIAFTYLRYASQVYSAGGSMLIKSESNSRQGSDKVEDIIMGSSRSENIQSEIEILKSRPLMTRVVNKLGLQFSYIAQGRIKDQNVYKQAPFFIHAFKIADSLRAFSLNIKFINGNRFHVNNEATVFEFDQVFENANGVFRLQKRVEAVAGAEYQLGWQPTEKVAAALTGDIKVLPKAGGTGILLINMEASNPYMAADIVNNLMVQYDSLTIEQNNFSTDQMLNFIDIRLNKLKGELDSIQEILLDYRQKNKLINVEIQSGNSFTKISAADQLINEQQMKLTVAEMVGDYLQDKQNQYNRVTVPSSLGLEDITLNELVTGYNKAQLARTALLESNIPSDNPAVKEAEGVIELQRQMVLENLKNIKSSFDKAIASLKGISNSEQNELQGLPYKMKELLDIDRQVTTKLALYSLLEGKREEGAISRASTISNSNIIDKATASTLPIKPDKRTIQIMAVLLGLALPALVIFLKEALNDKVTTRFDIEKVTQVPILGEIGHSFSGNTLVVNKTSRGMVAEQFRSIRSNLQYVISKIERPVILVSSSFSGEGKSFVSINMAAVMALTGKKTIILEFDIRKPKVLSGLGLGRRPGISNFLVGKAELKDLVVPVPKHENLFVLPCGPIPPNPAELLLDQKVTELFDWVRSEFDVVLVDTAPVGMVSDALTLGAFADCTLYLVRQGRTFKKQVVLIDELYRENKLPKVSIVINDVKIRAGYGYYGYGRYGYGYGYGQGQDSYYEEERPPLSSFDKMIAAMDFRKWFRRKK
jgi:tyrosine-protein kinase Etk/Wzc